MADILKLQSQHDGLEAKFFEERAALEAKYQKLYEPLYRMVWELMSGSSRPHYDSPIIRSGIF